TAAAAATTTEPYRRLKTNGGPMAAVLLFTPMVAPAGAPFDRLLHKSWLAPAPCALRRAQGEENGWPAQRSAPTILCCFIGLVRSPAALPSLASSSWRPLHEGGLHPQGASFDRLRMTTPRVAGRSPVEPTI